MECYDKITVMPTENERKFVGRSPDKLAKIIKLILKLAKIDGYNDEGHIKSKNGSYLRNSDLARLFIQAMTPSRLFLGEDDFIYLLYEARIYPDEIINNNYKAKLSKLYKNVSDIDQSKPKEPIIIENEEPPYLEPADTQTFVTYKRKRDDHDEEEEDNIRPPAKRSNWIMPEDE